jgi:DNA polymerase-3 subunit delta'
LALLSKVSSQHIATVFDGAESVAGGREETVLTFNLLLSLLRDLLLIRSCGQVGIANRFLVTELTAEAARFTSAGSMEALERALEIRQAVMGNANPKLAMERFLLTYDRLRKGV